MSGRAAVLFRNLQEAAISPIRSGSCKTARTVDLVAVSLRNQKVMAFITIRFSAATGCKTFRARDFSNRNLSPSGSSGENDVGFNKESICAFPYFQSPTVEKGAADQCSAKASP